MTTLPDRWVARDFPVLVAAARRLDERPLPLTASDLTDETDLDESGVTAALLALRSGDYLEVSLDPSPDGNPNALARGLTERGRRAVGLWPAEGEDGAESLRIALERALEAAPDAEQKGAIRAFLTASGRVSRDLVTQVVAAVVARQIGA